tara:strand:+ start:742 stop:1329 length:588 start_codon:yes stop_codon:yes gene_type:complete
MSNQNKKINTNFIGIYSIPDKELMDIIIKFFDQNINLQKPGSTGDNEINTEKKDNKEIRITPQNLNEEKYKIFLNYVEYLKKCYSAYKNTYPFLESLPSLNMGAFQIQKYEINGHCSAWHSERDNIRASERVFAWMTYLNDVPCGGETEFYHYGIKISPESGKTLIWPAEWTHAHRGNPTTKKEKYIMTGWLSFS